MNRTPPTFPEVLPGLIVGDWLRRTSGKVELYRTLLQELKRELETTGPQLARLLETGHTTQVVDLLQKLRESAATLGARRIAERAALLEKSLGRGEAVELQSLDEAMAEVLTSISGVSAWSRPLPVASKEETQGHHFLPIARRLDEHLRQNNLAALNGIDELRTAAGSRFADPMNALQQSLERLDFEAARTHLQEIAGSSKGGPRMTTSQNVRPRILIVDDQAENIRALRDTLREECELFFATSGAKALEIIESSDIDLVLLDVVMPDLDGLEVCRRLKAEERTASIPIIFVAGPEGSDDEERGLALGAADYIPRPVRPALLRARVYTQVELKRARDLLERLVSVDGLTGIANRRQFDFVLDQEWKRAARTGSALTVIRIEVDEFGAYNAAHGRARGDDCLRAVAMALATVGRRPSDLAARFGGEEFALILPEADREAAITLTRMLLTNVRDLALEHSASAVGNHVTISCGVVTASPEQSGSISTTLTLAVDLLDEARKGGRNHALHLDCSQGLRTRIVAEPHSATTTQDASL